MTNSSFAKSKRYWALVIVVSAPPILYALSLARSAARICTNDYWLILPSLLSESGVRLDLGSWLAPHHGQHVIPLTSFEYLLNISLTHGSNLGLTIAAWGWALVEFAFLIGLLNRSGPLEPKISIPLVALAAALCFTPASAFNWFHGYGGIHWTTSTALAMGSVYCFRRSSQGSWRWLLASLVSGALAMTAYSSALALWPAIVLGTFLDPAPLDPAPRRRRWLVIGCTVLVFALYMLMTSTLETANQSAKLSLERIVVFFLVYLGGPFTFKIEFAFALGLAGTLLALGMTAMLMRRRELRRELTPWVMIQVYSMGNALMTAVARSDAGLQHAIASRYVQISVLFWISIFAMAPYLLKKPEPLRKPEPRGFATAGAIVIAGLLILSSFGVGAVYTTSLRARAELQPLAELALKIGAPDTNATSITIATRTPEFDKNRDLLIAQGHVPFDAQSVLCAELGRSIPISLLGDELSAGGFDDLRQLPGGAIRAMGWLEAPTDDIECILMLGDERKVRGIALPGIQRPLVVKRFGAADSANGWAGYAQPAFRDEKLTAYYREHGRKELILIGAPRSLTDGKNAAAVKGPMKNAWRLSTWYAAGRFVSKAAATHFGASSEKLLWSPH